MPGSSGQREGWRTRSESSGGRQVGAEPVRPWRARSGLGFYSESRQHTKGADEAS